MKPVRELFRKFQRSDGRVKAATAIGVLALSAAIAVLGVIPALAGDGLPSDAGVQPVEIDYGGGSGGCAFIGSSYTEFHINNPMSGTYPLPGGAGTVQLVVTGSDTLFSYDFSNSSIAAFQITVNGGQKSLKYDNAASSVGPRNWDGGLHAPTKGNSQTNLFKLSHINFCIGSANEISGKVYDDANVSGDFESGTDSPEADVDITLLQGTTVKYTSATDANGNYSFYVPNGTYKICEEDRAGRTLTEPTTGTDCASLGSFEALGYTRTVPSASTSNDFGTATEVCGQTLTENGDTFDATIVVFANGNGEADCEDKVGSLFEETVGDDLTLNFPLAGGGTIAAIADIKKTFSSPTLFEPLRYTQGPGDLSVEVIPWCALREKTADDGDQFDPFLEDDTMYPSLAGIEDPSGAPSVACKVKEFEDIEDLQRTILLIQADPRFY